MINRKQRILLAACICSSAFYAPSNAALLHTNYPGSTLNSTASNADEISFKNITIVRPGIPVSNFEITGRELQNARNYIFTDVPANYWAHTSIATMTEQKYISGYADGTFKPDQAMTREEVASLFNKIIGGQSPVMIASSFSDITSDRWSANAIEAVARLNIISGYGDHTYHPDENMSRQEFAVVADNYLQHLGFQLEDPTLLDDIAYSDQKFIARWAQKPVKELAYLGFLSYNPHNLFNPEKYITRAEATEIAYRMTNTKEAISLRTNILHQRVEKKAEKILLDRLGSVADFNQEGFTYWDNNKFVIALKDKNKLKKVDADLAISTDLDVKTYVRTKATKYTQDDFDNLYNSASKVYYKVVPNGQIIDLLPNAEDGSLSLVVDIITAESQRAITQKFGHKVFLISPSAVPLVDK